MFGYTLKLVKKKDLVEEEQYQKIVMALNTQINDFMNWFRNDIKIDPKTIDELTLNVEGLHSMIDIYYSNKFSAPSTSINLFEKMDNIRKLSSSLVDVIEKYGKMNSLMMQNSMHAQKHHIEMDPDILDMYKECKEDLDTNAGVVVYKIIGNLKLMHLAIENDVIQLMLGVDVIELYKTRNKRLKHGDKYDDVTIKLKLQTKSDSQFINKEANKNERSGT